MQDRLLLGWLRSTIFGTVLSQYVSCQTALSLWVELHRVYSAISSARVMELRRLLQTTTRGGLSCNDYFERMRHIADQLTAVGESVSDSDLVHYVLNGLGSDFNSFIVALTTRSDPVSLVDLHGFLLTHESLLLSQHHTPLPTSDPVAMVTTPGRGRGRSQRGRGRGPSSSQLPLLPTPAGHARGGPVWPSRGAQSQFSYSQGRGNQAHQVFEEKPTCQICFKMGHSGLNCWYRSDFNLYPAEPSPQLQALVNTTGASPSEGWFLYSGATNHATSDINALSSFASYMGSDSLQSRTASL